MARKVVVISCADCGMNGTCHICGGYVARSDFEIDHVYPVSRGGTSEPMNLATSHRNCNRRKAARLMEEVSIHG